LKYLHVKYRYFKPGDVGCQLEQPTMSRQQPSNAAAPRSQPRSPAWAYRYQAAWWNAEPGAAPPDAAATPTHRNYTGPT